MKEYRLAVKNYKPNKIRSILEDLQEYDGYSKGVGRQNPDQGDLMKELVFKIKN